MGWFTARSRVARSPDDVAAERLRRLARQWRPGPDPGHEPDHEGGPASGQWLAPGALDPSGSAPSAPWQALLTPQRRGSRVSVLTWSGPAWRALVLVIGTCLAITAWWWWSGRPSEVIPAPVVLATGPPLSKQVTDQPEEPSQEPTLGAVVVHVTGLVAHPGLVTLPVGSRVADAVDAAGGVTRRRAAESVNLARVLMDGEQIVVGGPQSAAAVASAGGTGPAVAAPAIDLNSADATAFESLPGVGPVLAARIMQWRSANGPFRSVDELGEVIGIGDATLARLRPLVRV